ncbi:DUF6442 family protein [Paenibacillus yanchengensis]|uniref:DUF6442 family protein n=1 Tax=Paenibacillus yanchengensis TaxID=2035833 RepID=A0ABW4YMQ6_9BACL
MQKDELLEKYRSEKQDEGRDHLNHVSDSKGFSVMMVLAVLFMIYQIYKDVPFGDVPALLFSFLAVGGFHRYKKTREKDILIFSLFSSVVCIGFIIWYVIQTI